ncbi:hypothetical protein K474DRAFT_1588342 [Panus rudis PR-1116 ss-1]|nr:hypothetical protein K474DRAFT_1588342 [Panus rudis PR-1116 ss-1]
MSRIFNAWFLLYTLCLLCHTALADEPCTTRADGKYYDLSPLKSSKDYEFSSPGGQKYKLNVCRPVAQEIWNPKVDKPEDIGGVTRRAHGDFSIGYAVNTTLQVVDGHPTIVMTAGNACTEDSKLKASTAVRFICDTSVFGAGKPQLIAQLPPPDENACAFFVEWRTHVACPTHERGSWSIWAIVGTIVGVLFMGYILLGLLYNRFVLELRGLDAIPRYSFFSFSDTVAFFRRCVGRVRPDGGLGRRGYQGLAEEEASMLGGPPGFLDEEEEEEEEAGRGEGRREGMDASGPPLHDEHAQYVPQQQYSMYPPDEDPSSYNSLMYGGHMQNFPVVPQRVSSPPLPPGYCPYPLSDPLHSRPIILRRPPRHPSPSGLYDPLSPPISGSETSNEGPYHSHSRNSSSAGSPSSSRANSLVHRHSLRYNPTPSPTSSSAGRRSRGRSLSDDDDMGNSNTAEALASHRKEATRKQRIEAEQRRRDELREGYARLKDVLPISNQKSSKVSLLERATNHIQMLEKQNRELQERLQQVEDEIIRLRAINEKISLTSLPAGDSPSQVNLDSRPLSPPPDAPRSQGSNSKNSVEASSPAASEAY